MLRRRGLPYRPEMEIYLVAELLSTIEVAGHKFEDAFTASSDLEALEKARNLISFKRKPMKVLLLTLWSHRSYEYVNGQWERLDFNPIVRYEDVPDEVKNRKLRHPQDF